MTWTELRKWAKERYGKHAIFLTQNTFKVMEFEFYENGDIWFKFYEHIIDGAVRIMHGISFLDMLEFIKIRMNDSE